jgi:response regulator of citrate/malate metabolism
MRVIEPPPPQTRKVAIKCEVSGCLTNTSGGKIYCSKHVHLNQAAADTIAGLKELRAERTRIHKGSYSRTPMHLHDLKVHLEANGGALTNMRAAEMLQLNTEPANKYFKYLERKGILKTRKIKSTRFYLWEA